MPTFEVITGQESWQNHTAKLSCFFVDPHTFKETPLWSYVRAIDNPIIAQQLNRVTIQARPGLKSELGLWYKSNFTLPPNSILKIFGQRHIGQGTRDTKGQFFVRLRDDAAHRHMAMTLSRGVPGALPHAYIDGRFDILLLHEAEAIGLTVPDHFRKFFEPASLSHFAETVLSPEVASVPLTRRVRVRDEKGKEVSFVRSRKPRKLDL